MPCITLVEGHATTANIDKRTSLVRGIGIAAENTSYSTRHSCLLYFIEFATVTQRDDRG